MKVCPPLPDTLERFESVFTRFTELPALPASLEHLAVFAGSLTAVPELPPHIKYVDLRWNKIPQEAIPAEFPASLQRFRCDYRDKCR